MAQGYAGWRPARRKAAGKMADLRRPLSDAWEESAGSWERALQSTTAAAKYMRLLVAASAALLIVAGGTLAVGTYMNFSVSPSKPPAPALGDPAPDGSAKP